MFKIYVILCFSVFVVFFRRIVVARGNRRKELVVEYLSIGILHS